MNALTQAQIDAATSRELDALVAEYVMGWRYTEPWPAPIGCWGKDADGYGGVVWRYCTDFNDAGEVLERMIREGWTYELTGQAHHLPDAAFWHDGQPQLPESAGEAIRSSGQTLPEAICRAALKCQLAGVERRAA